MDEKLQNDDAAKGFSLIKKWLSSFFEFSTMIHHHHMTPPASRIDSSTFWLCLTHYKEHGCRVRGWRPRLVPSSCHNRIDWCPICWNDDDVPAHLSDRPTGLKRSTIWSVLLPGVCLFVLMPFYTYKWNQWAINCALTAPGCRATLFRL